MMHGPINIRFTRTAIIIIVNVLIFINIFLSWIAEQNRVGSRFTMGYILKHLIVNQIIVKRVLFEWLKLR